MIHPIQQAGTGFPPHDLLSAPFGAVDPYMGTDNLLEIQEVRGLRGEAGELAQGDSPGREDSRLWGRRDLI